MKLAYKPVGVCARRMDIEIEDDHIKQVEIQDGCSGNRQAVAALLKGMRVSDAIEKISGIRCGIKETSCPDQLAQALKSMLETGSDAENR